MTIKFKNAYLSDNYTIAGPHVKDGPLKYDDDINDYYDDEDTFEKCEIKQLSKSINCLLKRINKKENEIDLLLSADLLNQITISNYTMKDIKIPFFGLYNACASFCEELFIASSFIDSKNFNNIIISNSSHNLTSERQYRNPIEYGCPKYMYQTFTVTGATSALVTSKKTKIKITSGTIGKVVDKGSKDALNMGEVMTPSAVETLNDHLKELKIKPDYYDLILTGDLGKYGEEIFKEYAKKVYGYELKNYKDSATLIYDKNDNETGAGGSGIACLPLVTYSYIIPNMLNKKYKKVLLIATGALMSPTTVNQKMSIPSISHAISLEVE